MCLEVLYKGGTKLGYIVFRRITSKGGTTLTYVFKEVGLEIKHSVSFLSWEIDKMLTLHLLNANDSMQPRCRSEPGSPGEEDAWHVAS